jgi:hypothetical protein
MSNKSRLQTNNTNLQALINKANSLPDAGGGSGGNVETCTVTIDCVGGNIAHIAATIVENGVETIYTRMSDIDSDSEYPPYTIYNVKCGSAIVLNVANCRYSDYLANIDSGGILVESCKSSLIDRFDHWTQMFVFKAPVIANANCNILLDI